MSMTQSDLTDMLGDDLRTPSGLDGTWADTWSEVA